MNLNSLLTKPSQNWKFGVFGLFERATHTCSQTYLRSFPKTCIFFYRNVPYKITFCKLSNKKIIGADLIIFAEFLDGFISVDSNIRTPVNDIYVGGHMFPKQGNRSQLVSNEIMDLSFTARGFCWKKHCWKL